jgi:hypothetical protein
MTLDSVKKIKKIFAHFLDLEVGPFLESEKFKIFLTEVNLKDEFLELVRKEAESRHYIISPSYDSRFIVQAFERFLFFIDTERSNEFIEIIITLLKYFSKWSPKSLNFDEIKEDLKKWGTLDEEINKKISSISGQNFSFKTQSPDYDSNIPDHSKLLISQLTRLISEGNEIYKQTKDPHYVQISGFNAWRAEILHILVENFGEENILVKSFLYDVVESAEKVQPQKIHVVTGNRLLKKIIQQIKDSTIRIKGQGIQINSRGEDLEKNNSDIFSIFISRIDEDREIADKLKEFIVTIFPQKVDVFVASDPLNIAFADDWFDTIKKGIKKCDLMILLCTPDSVRRPWINFEAGAAIILERKIGPICFSGQGAGSLPSPLTYIRSQAIDCSDEHVFQKHFEQLFERIANKIDGNLPKFNVLESEFYQLIKPVSSLLTAKMDSSFIKAGEDIHITGLIQGSTSSPLSHLSVNLFQLGNIIEKARELTVPIKPDFSFEVLTPSEGLKPGEYGASIILPSGESTKLSFRID